MDEKLATLSADDREVLKVVYYLLSRKWLILCFVLAGLLTSVLYLHLVQPAFTARYKVTAVNGSSNALSSKLNGLGGVASMIGVSVGSAAGATPFELYIDRLTSREVADELSDDPRIMLVVFHDQWDNRSHTWHKATTGYSAAKNGAKEALGFPIVAWHIPNGDDLQTYLRDNLVIAKPGLKDPPITAISFTHKNPRFAEYVLGRINHITDRRIKDEALLRSTQYANYLASKLKTVTLVDHRIALTEALRQQEEAIMAASTDAPYAATLAEAPVASSRPTHPNGPLALALGLVAGLLIGLVAAFMTTPQDSSLIRHEIFELGP